MRSRRAVVISAITAAAAIPSLTGLAEVRLATWLSPGPGAWTAPIHWSSNPDFPNNSGSVTWKVTIALSGAQVLLDTPIGVGQHHHVDGNLQLQSSLTVLDEIRWSGGSMVGAGTLLVQNSLTLDGSNRLIAGVTIDVPASGITTWLGGELGSTQEEGGTFNNAGLFEDRTDADWTWQTAQTPVFNNTGVYRKLTGATLSDHRLDALFHNHGLVDVQAGALWLAGGGVSSGTFLAAAGTRLSFSDYAELYSHAGSTPTRLDETARVIAPQAEVRFGHLFGNASTDVDGQIDTGVLVADTGVLGELRFHIGAHVYGSVADPELHHLSGRTLFNTARPGGLMFGDAALTGGSIDGGDRLRVGGSLRWEGGAIRGQFGQHFVVDGDVQIIGPDPKFLVNRLYQANGDTTAGGGNLRLIDSDLVNTFGATWTHSGASMRYVDDDGTFISRFLNDGAFVSDPGAGESVRFERVEFYNNATASVSVASGVLRLGGGGVQAGAFTVAGGAELDIASEEFAGSPTQHSFVESATINGGITSRLRFSGAGTSSFAGAIGVGIVELTDSARLDYVRGSFSAGTLDVRDGSTLAMTEGNPKTLKCGHVSVDIATQSRIDLSDNRLVVDYTGASPIDSARLLIQSGFDGGSWTGAGLTSSTASDATGTGIGYAEATDLFGAFPAAFGGVAVDATSVLMAYTLAGDSDLDGAVNIGDFSRLAAHFNGPGRWFSGDFNYDQTIGIADFSLLAANFNRTLPSPARWQPAAGTAPEPMTGLIGMALLALRRRARSGG